MNNEENTEIKPHTLRKEVITTVAFDRGTTGILLSLCTLAGIAVGFSVANVAHAVRMDVSQPRPAQTTQYESMAPAWLGVHIRNDLDHGGAKVVKVNPASPAERAGLMAGDTVLWVGEVRTGSATSVVRSVRSHEPYEVTRITVLRRGEMVHLFARLDLMPTWVFRNVRSDLNLRCVVTALGNEACRLR